MTPTTTNPPAPPAATLAYESEPTRAERRYGRADCPMFVACGVLFGANLSLGALSVVAESEAVIDVWAGMTWGLFAAHGLLWALGQFLFWRRSDDPPPVSTFALATVAALGLAGLAVNFVYTQVVLR